MRENAWVTAACLDQREYRNIRFGGPVTSETVYGLIALLVGSAGLQKRGASQNGGARVSKMVNNGN